MKTLQYTALLSAAIIISSCGTFRKYEEVNKIPENLFGEEVAASGFSNGMTEPLPWKSFFTDPLLQELIDSALVRNLDLTLAGKRVKEAEAILNSSKLGYLPSLSVSPSYTITSGGSYDIPLTLDWGVQGFGSITNRLRETKALVLQASDEENAVKSRLVAGVAEAYFNLQMLDRQYEIIESTEQVWSKLLETQKALMQNGRTYSTAVDQMEASLLNVKIQKSDILREIEDSEASICLMLGMVPGDIRRNPWGEYSIPESICTGLPAQLLENRPDVRSAGRNVEAAYYVTNQARSAMFPSLSLSGLLGWTSQGKAISDPATFIYNAVASLTQPIFARGRLRSNLEVSRLRQEEAAETYTQTVLKAGNDVNRALREINVSKEKDALYKRQVEVLTKAFNATEELMHSGKALYLEVLIAQKDLLGAKLGEAVNLYNGSTGLINLYVSLGGGVK
ncbi:MAG: TolC family protein [Bacteroidales bacterium]|nr:TolC family protein [Bacteroidales bacterium]